MDDYDYILSADPDSAVIEIEQVDEVVNFDKGFYVEDKAVHILNMLSTNNRNLDINKYKKYWDQKVSSLLELDTSPSMSVSYNSNLFPLVSLKKKVTEQDLDDNTRMVYTYEEDDVILESTESYLRLRKNLVGPYSLASENRLYSQLAPNVSQGSYTVGSNTDCYVKGPNTRSRMLAPCPEYKGDSHVLSGYYNAGGKEPPVTFDVSKYWKELAALTKGDTVSVYMNDGKVVEGSVTSRREGEVSFVVPGRKTPLTFTSSSAFLVFPQTFEPKFAKKDLLTQNIVFEGAADNSLGTLTGNDIVTLQPFWKPSSLDEFKSTFPQILDHVTKNEPLTKYFSKFKASMQAPIRKVKPHKPLKSKWEDFRKAVQERYDDLQAVDRIYSWLKTVKIPDAATVPAAAVAADKPSYTTVFRTVDEMLKKPGSKGDIAALISASYFKQGKNKRN